MCVVVGASKLVRRATRGDVARRRHSTINVRITPTAEKHCAVNCSQKYLLNTSSMTVTLTGY